MTEEAAKDKGNACFKSGDYDGAVTAYSEALDIGGSNHVIFSNRSGAYAKLGKWDKAKEDAQSACDMRPEWPKGWSRLGAAELGLKNHKAAVDAYKRGVALDGASDQMKKDLAYAENMLSGKGGASTASSGSGTRLPTPPYVPPKAGGNLIVGGIVFLLNVGVLSFSVLAMVPGDTQFPAYRKAMFMSLIALLMSIFNVHGFPRISTFTKVYRIMRGKQGGDPGMFAFLTDSQLHYMLYASLFMTSAPSFMFVLPLITISAYSIANYAQGAATRVSPKLGAIVTPLAGRFTKNGAQINKFNANVEVIIFFYMIFQLFTPYRHVLLLGLYGHAFLRIRYMANQDSKDAWAKVKARTDGIMAHPAWPPVIKSGYEKIVTFATGLGNPEPPKP